MIRLTDMEIEKLTYDECLEQVELPLIKDRIPIVVSQSPFYQEKYSAVGIQWKQPFHMEQFFALPFTSKKEMLNEQEHYPPFGRLAAEQIKGRRIHITSGSTGRPFLIMMTDDDSRHTAEAGGRAFRCAGLEPSDMVVHCLNYCMWAGGITDHLSLEATGASVIPFGVGNSHKLIETILSVRPTAISCTPSYLSRLELLLKEEFNMSPSELRLKKAFLGGEGGLQNPEVRRRIEQTWAIKAIDANYGMSEVLSIIGSECDAREGLHFHGQGIIFLELVDPADGSAIPVEDGREGEMVLTTLQREAQPLIRYRTGDIIKIIGTRGCRCGRNSLRFLVTGRADDMITVCGINVYPGAVASLIAEKPEYFSGEFEFVLDTPPPYERPLLRIELANRELAGDTTGIEQFLTGLCHNRLNFTPAVQFIAYGDFPRSDGKTKRIKKCY